MLSSYFVTFIFMLQFVCLVFYTQFTSAYYYLSFAKTICFLPSFFENAKTTCVKSHNHLRKHFQHVVLPSRNAECEKTLMKMHQKN